MELHPDFTADSGRMAVSYYDRGIRFVDIAKDGMMKEIGWIVPAEGYSGSPQTAAAFEVVRLLDKEATGTRRSVVDRIAPGSVELASSTQPLPMRPAQTGAARRRRCGSSPSWNLLARTGRSTAPGAR